MSRTTLKDLSLLAQPLLGLPPALQEHRAAESRAAFALCVPCQEIWGPHLCGRNRPFFTRKMLFLRSLFPLSSSLCLVILPQEAPWGVQPVEINHPAQWAELLFPSDQGEEHIFSLCFSPRLYHNKREGDIIKGTSVRHPVSLDSSCAGVQGLQKTLQIWSLLRSPELPSGVALLSPLTPDRP